MIRLRNLSKSYDTAEGRLQVLDNLTVDFPAGENIGILGHGGVGKSTLLRLISGMDKPDRGSVERFGTVSWPVGVVCEYRRAFTGRENATFIGQLNGFKGKKLRDFVFRVGSFAELGDDYSAPLNHYSVDMCTRFDFSVSMASNFNTYLVDGMIQVGSESFKRKCKDALAEKARYSDLIIVSSDVNELKAYCTSGAYLSMEGLELFPDLDSAIVRYQKSLH